MNKLNLFLAAVAVALCLTSCGDSNTKKELFNGKDLAGWVCFLDPTSGVATQDVYGVKDSNIHIKECLSDTCVPQKSMVTTNCM